MKSALILTATMIAMTSCGSSEPEVDHQGAADESAPQAASGGQDEIPACDDSHEWGHYHSDEDIAVAVRRAFEARPDDDVTSGPHVLVEPSEGYPDASPEAPVVTVRFTRGDQILVQRLEVSRPDESWQVDGVAWTCQTGTLDSSAARDEAAGDEAAPVARLAPRRPHPSDFTAEACTVSEPQPMGLELPSQGWKLDFDVDDEGGMLAWRSGPREVTVLRLDADGSPSGEPVTHEAPPDRRGGVELQRVGERFALAASGRCDRRYCFFAYALDAEGRAIGQRRQRRLRFGVANFPNSLRLHQRDDGRMWLYRDAGSGGRDAFREAYGITVTAEGPELVDRAFGVRAANSDELSGESFWTHAYLFDVSDGELGAVTGWEADFMGGTRRGRSLYIGEQAGELRGVGRRIRDFLIVDGRAHLLVEDPQGTFMHQVATVNASRRAEVEEPTSVDADTLPAPFSQRAIVDIDWSTGQMRVRGSLGDDLVAPLSLEGLMAITFTGERFIGLRSTPDGAARFTITCGD